MTQTVAKNSLKPIGNRVVVQRKESEETTKSGIILPESAKKKPETAVVCAIGDGKLLKDGQTIEMPVKVGDVILMDKYAGQEVTLDDEEFVILKADDILAIVQK